MSLGADERTQMNSMAILLATCDSVSIEDWWSEAWPGSRRCTEQQQRERTAEMEALYSMLAATTSGRAKEIVKQGVADRNGMVAFGRIGERSGKTGW